MRISLTVTHFAPLEIELTGQPQERLGRKWHMINFDGILWAGPRVRYVKGLRIQCLPIGASRGPCVKCGHKSSCGSEINDEHHITYIPEVKVFLCRRCHQMITSVNSHAGVAKRAPLNNGEREFLWEWFLTAKYFDTHRRFSRGRARKLLEKYLIGGGHVTDAEIDKPANG